MFLIYKQNVCFYFKFMLPGSEAVVSIRPCGETEQLHSTNPQRMQQGRQALSDNKSGLSMEKIYFCAIRVLFTNSWRHPAVYVPVLL
ncbi:MAG: hypothetical protein R2791_10975 [Saprospiraceae bacterium]